MSFSFFATHSHQSSKIHGDKELSIVLNIESGHVRGSLVLFSRLFALQSAAGPAIPPKIFHMVSSEIVSRGDTTKTGVQLLSAMIEAVARVSETLAKEGLKISSDHSVNIPISKIHIIFSSPWIITKTKTVHISYEKETEITAATVSAILDGERNDLQKQFMAEHDTMLEFDLAFIEQKLFEVRLNGYPVVHFEGKKAREIEVSFAISVSAKSILSGIEKTIEKSFRTAQHNVAYHSSLLLQYSALRNIVFNNNDCIVIHVHAEITDVIVIKKGICAALASFPKGTGTLVRTSAASLQQSNEIAQSTLNIQATGSFHPEESRRVAMKTSPSARVWAQQFTETLASVCPDGAIPRRIYVLANAHYSHFEQALTATGKSFEITHVEKSILDSAVSHANKERENTLMNLYVFALR